MALLYWIQFVITETSYIETYFRSHEVPVPLLLIEEVGSSPCLFVCFFPVLLILYCCEEDQFRFWEGKGKESFGLFSDKGTMPFCFVLAFFVFSFSLFSLFSLVLL